MGGLLSVIRLVFSRSKWTRPFIRSMMRPISLSALSLADLCMSPSLSGVHWGLMGSIDIECLHGCLLIGAEATEAWRPFPSQRQSYCA